MPEEIRPNRQVAAGFVDLGRPGQTGFDALSGALEATVRLGKETIKAAQVQSDLEVAEVAETLQDPTLSVEETESIEEDAFFPMAKIKARNRKGEAFVEQNRENLEDELAKATDVVDARRIYREHQQRTLALDSDPAVQAGIREHYAQIAGPLLRDAVIRRRAQVEVEERTNRNASLDSAVRKDSEYFFGVAQGQVFDEELAKGEVGEIHDDIVDAMVNQYSRSPSSSEEILKFINMVDKPGIGYFSNEADRKKYSKLRDAITAEEIRRNDQLITERQQKHERRDVQREINEFIKQNPVGTPIPEDQEAYLTELFDDPLDAQTWIEDAQEAAGKVTLVGTAPFKAGLQTLNTSFGSSMIETNPRKAASKAAAQAAFFSIAASMDPAVLQEPDGGFAAMQKLAGEAKRIAEDEDKQLLAAQGRVNDFKTDLILRHREATTAGNVEGQAAIMAEFKKFESSPEAVADRTEKLRFGLLELAEQAGFDIRDDILIPALE